MGHLTIDLVGRKQTGATDMNQYQYVVGFAFSKDLNYVLLVKKNRPEWQKGYLNGIGGKIEESDNSPIAAMYRECMEEAGIDLLWEELGIMEGTNDDGGEFKCYIFYAYSDRIFDFKQREDEYLDVYTADSPDDYWRDEQHIANLEFLIPFGIYHARGGKVASYIRLEYNNA